MAAKPPLAPLASVIEFTVTVFPVPTFLLLNDDKFELVKVSDPIKPESDIVDIAMLFPSYVLLEALNDETVSDFLEIWAVVV